MIPHQVGKILYLIIRQAKSCVLFGHVQWPISVQVTRSGRILVSRATTRTRRA